MRDTTCSVPDVASRGLSSAASTGLNDSLPVSTSFPAASVLPWPGYSSCFDPNCSCERCMVKCDLLALDGYIPVNDAWWRTQTIFPVEYGPIEIATPVEGGVR